MGTYDAVIIGGGHNGLVTAAYLAKAGRKVLVLERRDETGGILANVQLGGGVQAPGIVHTVGRLRDSVISDLGLAAHGLQLIRPKVRVYAPQPDGSARTFWGDAGKTAEELKRYSPEDATSYPAYDQKVKTLASFLAYLNATTPPDIDNKSAKDAMQLLKVGKAYKGLGPEAARELTRAIPMAVADFVKDEFSSEALRGAMATRGVLYTGMGVWSAGTAFVLLNDSAGNDGGAAGQTVFAKGGPKSVADALTSAAAAFGAEIRTGAEVMQITTTNGNATGVVLASGDEIGARAVVTAASPKHTLLDLVDPMAIGPRLRWEAGNIRTPGNTAKVNLALSGMPAFAGNPEQERLEGRIVIAPGIDYVEKAFDSWKYGAIAEEPLIEATIPTLTDPSLAPDGTHVMSMVVQSAPRNLRDGDWDAERDRLADIAVKTMEQYAPGLGDLITARQVLTPVDLERDYSLPGGHIYHAEHGLDSFFLWRPLFGHGRYRFGLPGLYLAGSGAHPGGGITGAPGANAAREILSDLK
ncbi:MAG: NAD(P)/FAD-dependent oxidoreductase [Actinomycetota bacterium]